MQPRFKEYDPMLPETRDPSPHSLQDPLDLRAVPRVAVDLPVDLCVRDLPGPLPGRARDLGVSGACIASASPFALKSVQELVLPFPRGPLRVSAEGIWQRELPSDDLVLTGVIFRALEPAALDQLWDLVFASGKRVARFLYERARVRELGVDEGLGLAEVSRYREVPAGRFAYRQGMLDNRSIYFLARGQISLKMRVRDAIEVEIERLQPGALFGGMPLLTDLPHAESAVAVDDVQLLEIEPAAYRFLRQAKPWLGFRLSQALLRSSAQRLHAVATQLHDKL